MYVPNCSVEIAKQKKEVLERLQKTLEELSQRVPEVGRLAWPDGSIYEYTCRSHSHGHICGDGTEASSVYSMYVRTYMGDRLHMRYNLLRKRRQPSLNRTEH